MVELKTILVEYAQQRGGGLPLSAEEICNAVVMWCQEYVKDNTKQETITAELLQGLIDGSETVVVDLNESGDKLEIHLDYEVIQKLDRSVLTPLSIPQIPKLPVLGVNGAVEWEDITGFISKQMYKHTVIVSDFSDNVLTAQYLFTFYSSNPAKITVDNIYGLLGNFSEVCCYYGVSRPEYSEIKNIIPQKIYVAGDTHIRINGIKTTDFTITDRRIQNPTINDTVVEL